MSGLPYRTGRPADRPAPDQKHTGGGSAPLADSSHHGAYQETSGRETELAAAHVLPFAHQAAAGGDCPADGLRQRLLPFAHRRDRLATDRPATAPGAPRTTGTDPDTTPRATANQN